MINISDSKRKLVIPQWLNLNNAIASGELSSLGNGYIADTAQARAKLYKNYELFLESPSLYNATDLLGVAYTLGEMTIAIPLSKYIMNQNEFVQPVALQFAKKILGLSKPDEMSEEISKKINKNKTYLRQYSRNSIKWIEQARLYTVIGQFNKAEQAVVIAVNLAPSNRYIVRSCVRFYWHIKEYEKAWNYINKATKITRDPWIEASKINLDMILKKRIGNIKNMVSMEMLPDKLFHFSELIETFGLLELDAGNDKKAKKAFQKAWTKPSKNVLTHGEWVLRNAFPHLQKIVNLDLTNTPEGAAYHNYWIRKYDKAMEYVRQWEMEEPYSKRPFILGSSISCNTQNFEEAVKTARAGLVANNKDFTLKNNLCYALLRMSKITEAEEEFKTLTPSEDIIEKIVYSATKGLLAYKKGEFEKGREFYQKSIQLCRENKENRLMAKAYMNFALAELENVPNYNQEYIDTALSLPEKDDTPDIYLARKELKDKKIKFPSIISKTIQNGKRIFKI